MRRLAVASLAGTAVMFALSVGVCSARSITIVEAADGTVTVTAVDVFEPGVLIVDGPLYGHNASLFDPASGLFYPYVLWREPDDPTLVNFIGLEPSGPGGFTSMFAISDAVFGDLHVCANGMPEQYVDCPVLENGVPFVVPFYDVGISSLAYGQVVPVTLTFLDLASGSLPNQPDQGGGAPDVPEPSTMLLLASGLLALTVRARLRPTIPSSSTRR